MSHRTTWLIAIVAGLVAILLAVVVIIWLLAPESNTHPTTTSAPVPQPTPSHPTTAPALPTVELQPPPHSPLADVNLPAGVVFAGNSSNGERWRYTAPYDDIVAFFRTQFATGRKYDADGATWWRDLPPCYNNKYEANTATPRHESPPGGWVMEDSTLWLWTDGSVALSVEVFRPSSTDTPSEIVIGYTYWHHAYVCNRN